MSVSLIIVSLIILLILFGAGQRILDQMRLNDKQALVIMVLIAIGLIIPPIYVTRYFCFSIGGFLIPLVICIYMLISAGWSRDLGRAMLGTILVAGIIYGLEWIMPADPEELIVDPFIIYGLVAGLVAYILGRSRRNAFVSAVLGISLSQIIQLIVNHATGIKSVLGLGVGGAFGTMLIAVIISVAVSEFLGRAFETASKDENKKEFNYKTHTYDSEKNGKLKASNKKKTKEAK